MTYDNWRYRMHAWSRVVIGLGVVFICPSRTVADDPRPIDVCEIAQRLTKFENKIVAVRGEFFSGRHGATVGREQCKTPTPFNEFGAGIALNLAFPSAERDAGIELDQDSIRRFRETKARIQKDQGSDAAVVATFVGLLQVRSAFKLKADPDGGYSGNGYGFLGRYPAQIVMQRITDVVAKGNMHQE